LLHLGLVSITPGGEEDQQLVATFHDGKTVSIPKNKAMWIPRELYERTVFEIGLPKNVRQEFATQDFYPYYSSCGYPTSGSLAFPVQFDQFVPRGGYVEAGCRGPVGWASRSCGGHPWMARSKSATAVGGQDHHTTDELIPGTELTKSQLNSKVMAQIMHSEKMDWRHEARGDLDGDGRPLKMRTTDDGGVGGVLKKSVSFADLRDAELHADLSLSDDDDDDRWRGETAAGTRDAAVGTRTSPPLARTASPQRRAAWRYWNSDPSPSLHEPLHVGQYRQGPYRDCVNSVSVLLRDTKKTDYNTGHLLSVFTYV